MSTELLCERAKNTFLSRVRKGREDECWEWSGATGVGGYGKFHARPYTLRAHRVAWFIVNGPIPSGMCICHRCDNRKCCNPSHLFLGTFAENSRDMVLKGRSMAGNIRWIASMRESQPKGDDHYSRKLPHLLARGAKNGNATLTEATVANILKFISHGVPQSLLAREFGVSTNAICKIAKRKTWRHVTAAS